MSTRFSEWQEDKNTTAGQCREWFVGIAWIWNHLVSEWRDLLRIQDHLPEETDKERAPSLQQNNWLFTSLPDTRRYYTDPYPRCYWKIKFSNLSFNVFLIFIYRRHISISLQRLQAIKKSQNCRKQGFYKFLACWWKYRDPYKKLRIRIHGGTKKLMDKGPEHCFLHKKNVTLRTGSTVNTFGVILLTLKTGRSIWKMLCAEYTEEIKTNASAHNFKFSLMLFTKKPIVFQHIL
jgi:hypothetical protein